MDIDINDIIASMIMSERGKIVLRWMYASLAISVLTFLITVFCIYKYRSTKAVFIAGGASISVLALLISHALTIAVYLGQDIRVALSSVLLSIQYSFAFYTIFYAFNCLMINASKSKKLVVYFGYIWIVVAIACAIAATAINAGGNFANSETARITVSDLIWFVSYTIWGSIAIALLLFFMNIKLLNRKTKFTMLAFIGLNVIASITILALNYTNSNVSYSRNGIFFFLSELPMDISIVLAAYYGLAWIQDHSTKEKIGSQAESEV